MRKINRNEAFMQASEAALNGDISRANHILKIIDRSIANDRRNHTYSEEIILTREEKKYFHFDD